MTRFDIQIENFLATLHGLTLDEAMANAELDARAYNWPRKLVRELGARIRARYARRPIP